VTVSSEQHWKKQWFGSARICASASCASFRAQHWLKACDPTPETMLGSSIFINPDW
jgi:hypothetical protein